MDEHLELEINFTILQHGPQISPTHLLHLHISCILAFFQGHLQEPNQQEKFFVNQASNQSKKDMDTNFH